MKPIYKKSVKFITLLITALLIATVSAATYRYMYIDGSVTVGSAKMVWVEGTDSPGDATVSGSTYTVDFDVGPGTPVNFTECVFLKNQDTSAHNMTISIPTEVLAADFDECKMHIYENSTASWVYVDTLDLTNSADTYETYTGNDPLDAGEYYRMTFEVAATAGASGTYDFDIQVEYE
jgi:hypothetical protein